MVDKKIVAKDNQKTLLLIFFYASWRSNEKYEEKNIQLILNSIKNFNLKLKKEDIHETEEG